MARIPTRYDERPPPKVALERGSGPPTLIRRSCSGNRSPQQDPGLSGLQSVSAPLRVAYLRLHLAKLAKEKREFGDSYRDHGKLFCHPDGQLINPDTITRRLNRLVDRGGVPLIRLHDVRHTYATLSVDAGVDPKILSDRIGHANMAYTMSIYTHR